jgi:hypothetical protein
MATFYTPKLVTDGLVLCLDAGNTKSYPGSGTTWTDISRNSNTGTLSGGPTFSSANGGSIVFDGTDDNALIANPLSLKSQNFTISTWINPNSQYVALVSMIDFDHHLNQAWVLQSEDATTNRYYYLAWNDGTQFQPANQFGPGKGIQVTASVWQNIVYTKSGTTLIGYLNGNRAFAPPAAGNANVNYGSNINLNIGKWGLAGRAFRGNISNTQIYNRALTPAEVQQTYNAIKGRYGL